MDVQKDKERKKVGKLGEDEACKYLMDNGHTILQRNWRSGHLEIDIVTMDHSGVHFVEVKTRRPPMSAAPHESVNATKQNRIAMAAGRYLRKIGSADMECFFDIITVVFDEDGMKVKYFPRAFVPVYFGK